MGNMETDFKFHHLGIACISIEQESEHYLVLGYSFESDDFTDAVQGVRGRFLNFDGAPRIELLENLPESKVLDPFLERRTKIYHLAFSVADLEIAIAKLKEQGALLISEPQVSVFFRSRICFLFMPNFQMVELIENALPSGRMSD
jgi:hypothetical protein